MIAYLRGKVLSKQNKEIILDTGNIGYRIFLKKNLISEIGAGQDLELFIYSHIREDSFDLYGFEKEEQLDFFKKLIEVNGIGPKVAMEILSIDPGKIKSAIINEDLAFICQIPGIGKKIAQRVIMELKDKIAAEDIELREYQSIEPKINDDVISALIKLGYQRNEIKHNLENLPAEITKAEEIITFFLKNN